MPQKLEICILTRVHHVVAPITAADRLLTSSFYWRVLLPGGLHTATKQDQPTLRPSKSVTVSGSVVVVVVVVVTPAGSGRGGGYVHE